MLVGNSNLDFRFGGTGPNGQLEPTQKDRIPKEPEIDLSPFQQRWQLMRLEYMSKWYARHRDLSRHINPKRGFFEGFVPNWNAQYDYKLIIDDNPAHYARILAAGMQSGLTSPARPWFRLGVGIPELEEREDVKQWLEIVEKRTMRIFAGSNIYDAFHQTYEELGDFGTGAFGIFEDYKSVIRARSYTCGEYYLGTDYAGRVNSFARQYWMTVDQLVEEYGWNNVSGKVKAMYNSGARDTYVLIYTLCEPNTSRVKGYSDFKGMEWRSVTWEALAPYKQALRCRGYNEFPYMAPRWELTTTADIYGNGPGSFALGNIKMLYRMQKDSLLAINKVADPPIIQDASVEGTANTLPGGITRSSSTVPNSGVRPAYQVNPDINAIEAKIAKTDQKIASRFYADLFLMMIQSEKTDMTAREVVERHEEKLLMLGPVIGRVKSDMLDPTFDRVFNIGFRAGIYPPPPRAIQGMPLHVEYISLLAQAQKMVGTAAIEQTAAFVGSLVPVYPQAADNFDADEAIREYSDMIGSPPKIIRSKEDMMNIRAEKAKQAQAAQNAQAMAAAAQTGKVLSDTKVGGGSALEHLLGVGPEQPGTGSPVPGGSAT